jgi:hypothetical protein
MPARVAAWAPLPPRIHRGTDEFRATRRHSGHDTASLLQSQFRAFKLDVLRVRGDRIAEITTFDATLFEAFGLPATL